MCPKHVLVTGANGFIGKNLCRRLIESGKEVTACIREQADSSIFVGIPGPLRVCRISSLDDVSDLFLA